MATIRHTLAVDIGTNSVGSMWFDHKDGGITVGTSIFPAGVDETDDKRGDPKNAKRRMTRRTRITLRRRAERKRELRLKLIACGLLPKTAEEFKTLLQASDPWMLRREGLDKSLTPHQFGRVLLHLAQRRGALGLHIAEAEEGEDGQPEGGGASDDGKVKAAIGEMRIKMRDAKVRTFGEFIAGVRSERVHALPGPDPRPKDERKGPREYRDAIRNKAGNYEHCADRAMIRDEFAKLWEAQKNQRGETAKLLTDALRGEFDNEQGDSIWRHKGLLFGQRRQTWDLGTLGRCVLEPTERCAPHADMHASRYLVVETVNNLRIIERGTPPRSLTKEEREKIKFYLSGPLGTLPETKRTDKKTKKVKIIPERPKQNVSVTDLREKMAEWYGKGNWPGGNKTKLSPFRFNIEADEDRQINADWFSREIIHGAIGAEAWAKMPERLHEGINKAILKHDPNQDGEADQLKAGVTKWAGLNEKQAGALVAAWAKRPKLDAKRLNMSRRAVMNLLTVMDRPEPWPEPKSEGRKGHRWLTQIEGRKAIANWERTTGDTEPFKDVPTGKPMDDITRRRYATGAKGATASDRHYMGKHILMKNGKPIIGPDGHPLAEPPPAPLISNPVVRKAIHEVRRHVVEYMTTFGRKPDEIYIELAREARMGAKDSDRALFRNRLRNRIRNDIIEECKLHNRTPTQQRAAVDRVVLCMQQGGAAAVCPLCGKGGITPRKAAEGDGCEVAHIIPKGSGGHNGLGNVVLSHTKCNRDMARRTPRQFWSQSLKEGFDEGFRWVEGVFGDVGRPKPAEMKKAMTEGGHALWSCYFDWKDDKRKIEQFSKDVKDIQEMTQRQDAATKYAARQVMAYLSDALFDGKGLPERSGGNDQRTIFASDGMWTSRLRREWGLFFDPHYAKAKGLSNDEEHGRKEKNRGDHRHHAIDAIVIGLCSESRRNAWKKREEDADAEGINTADEEKMANYRRLHPLDPPAPFKTREEFWEAVKAAVFGDEETPRPICHRPVKRKLVGELHEAFPRGPVLDRAGKLTDKFTKRISILNLDPNHLREPRTEPEKDAIERLAARRMQEKGLDQRAARKWARSIVQSPGYTPLKVDPPPDKSGLVRDPALRRHLRACLSENGLNPDDFSAAEIKKLVTDGRVRQPLRDDNGKLTPGGPPIRSVVLLWTIKSPVVASLWRDDHATGKPTCIYNAETGEGDSRAARAYIGGNQHHIEIRVNEKGEWKGEMVSMFEASRRKLAKLRAFRAANVPKPKAFQERGEDGHPVMSNAERARWRPIIASIERAHPMVDRRDNESLGGRFILSLCEGETLHMVHKETKVSGYFVVAKIDSDRQLVVVPHWDARAAGLRKDSENKPIPDSKREQFAVSPSDLASHAPPGHPHAVKVRVSPLGIVNILEKD